MSYVVRRDYLNRSPSWLGVTQAGFAFFVHNAFAHKFTTRAEAESEAKKSGAKVVRVRTAADLREERLALRADKKVAIKALCDIRIELIYLGLGASKAFDMATTALRKLDPAVMPQEKREIVLRSSGGGASVARQARLATKR